MLLATIFRKLFQHILCRAAAARANSFTPARYPALRTAFGTNVAQCRQVPRCMAKPATGLPARARLLRW